ncbi:MAG: alcohol dehydrogenase catalytic domain-containing protein [Bacteroidota bacterium]
MMNTLVVRAPMDFGIEKKEVPLTPSGGLLLKILACGLCGSDLRTLRSGHRKIQLPFTIGHEICARVAKAGKVYSGPWKEGDTLAVSPLVYCGKCIFCRNHDFEYCPHYREIAQAWPGGFAEYLALPEEAIAHGTIQRVPEGLDPVHATVVEPLSSCVNAQEKGNITLGDSVLIIGAGPIGTLHLELARARGADQVIFADISADRLKMAEVYEPDLMINTLKQDLKEEVLKITKGVGPSVIITANPDPATQVVAVELARKGGRILLFGGLPADKAVPGVNMNTVHYNSLHLIGTTIFAPRHNNVALGLLIKGRISAEKFISHQFKLMDFNKGAQLALEGRTRKIVFTP